MGRTMRSREHGTYSMYNTGKCRCDLCRVAAAEKRARYRPQLGDQPKNYNVRFGSAKIRLDAAPFVKFLYETTLVDALLLKRIRGWERNGIDLYYADKLAIEFGSHPALIWGDDFYQGCPGFEEVA